MLVVTAALGSAVSQVPFQTAAKGYRSGVAEFAQIVVRNQAEWAALWKKHTSFESNPAPPPAIDFSKETVAAVFLGERPTGGHEVEIVRIDKNATGVSASFVEKRPPQGAIVTQSFTQPFHIVRFATQGSGSVGFRRLP